MQPAIVPALESWNTWRTSAAPSTVSLISGLSRPLMRLFTSSTAL